ncbi:MAG: hypothetical protein U9R29_05335 [Thermodesulfobacteriota bacterium]|nr:hypothetical protein [Thermodesulfobacteriota bacterium]
MTRQLNLRVNNDFAERLEKLSRRLGQPMSTVLEAIGTPAIEAQESDFQFEEKALAAWENYQLNGVHVTDTTIDALFTDALKQATIVAEKRTK